MPEEEREYEYKVIVVGGGPGGYVAAIKAAQMGQKVAIVEKENFGGTCLNVGCIPTKTLLRSVEALKAVEECARFGIIDLDNSKAKLDMSKVQMRKKTVVSQLVGGVNGLLRANGVTSIKGEGRIVDAHTVAIGEKIINANFIIIATGSVSKSLTIPIDSKMEVLTSTEMLDIDQIPESIAIIGGGVIGIEFAYLLASIGTKVTVIEFLDHILPMVDEEISAQVTDMLTKMGITIHTGAKVTEITADGVNFEENRKIQSIKSVKVLMAVGRTPSLTGIDCEALGIQTNRGAIVTDEKLKTTVDSIYAIGDVNGKVMLAHTASAEAIVAVKNIIGEKASMDYSQIPSAIYVQPEIASVGLTEKLAKGIYGDVKVGKFPLLANGKAKVAGEERGLIKVITEPKNGEIVGVHIFAIHATDIIAEVVTAMKLGATAEALTEVVHPHPTVSEAIHEAMHAVNGRPIHYL